MQAHRNRITTRRILFRLALDGRLAQTEGLVLVQDLWFSVRLYRLCLLAGP